MSRSAVLRVTQVSKSFALYDSARQRLMEALFGGMRHRNHEVLHDINFDLLAGESVGLVGRNGAGKSTLLKLITGVLLPDQGRIHSAGSVAGLLELGTGFDMNLSGRENIQINGQLLGMSASHIGIIEKDIIAFSELWDVIDDPMRTYSSGMVMRLGFSIAIHAKPACFILDEALAVGDAAFQQKCLAALQAHREAGGSLLVVSHDLNAIQMLCDRALLLEGGEIIFEGTPLEVTQNFLRLMAGYQAEAGLVSIESYGQKRVLIEACELQHAGHRREVFLSGETAQIAVTLGTQMNRSVVLGFLIKDRFGQEIFGTNTGLLGERIELVTGNTSTYIFELPLSLAPGHYTVTMAVHGDLTHLEDCEHWWDHALRFEIQGYLSTAFAGVCQLPVSFYASPTAIASVND